MEFMKRKGINIKRIFVHLFLFYLDIIALFAICECKVEVDNTEMLEV